MLHRIRELQHALGMSDAELLQLAREAAGTSWLRCVEDLGQEGQLFLLVELRRLKAVDDELADLTGGVGLAAA
jgi:hypothetical protein